MIKLSQILSSNIIFLFIFVASSFGADQYHITGKAKIIDGDTIRINGKKIRLFGIDAPEINQSCKNNYEIYSCGEAAKSFLSIFATGVVTCFYSEKDRYKRILGTCFNGSPGLLKFDINARMVKVGYAVAYKRYSKKYLNEENFARKNKSGIWSGDFLRPEEWRRKKK